MKLEVRIIKTAKRQYATAITCALEIDGKYSESISEEQATKMVEAFGLKFQEKQPTTKLNNNTGMFDFMYA